MAHGRPLGDRVQSLGQGVKGAEGPLRQTSGATQYRVMLGTGHGEGVTRSALSNGATPRSGAVPVPEIWRFQKV